MIRIDAYARYLLPRLGSRLSRRRLTVPLNCPAMMADNRLDLLLQASRVRVGCGHDRCVSALMSISAAYSACLFQIIDCQVLCGGVGVVVGGV